MTNTVWKSIVSIFDPARGIGSIIYNVLGGVIVAILSLQFVRVRNHFRRWRLKSIFGQDADPEGIFHIVYAKFSLPVLYNKLDEIITYPYSKPKRAGYTPEAKFSIKNPVSSCELRAAKHLTSFFVSYLKNNIMLNADTEIDPDENRSFVSIGGISNYRTIDTLDSDFNHFVRIGSDSDNPKTVTFVSVKDGNPLVNIDNKFDYGIILKLSPDQFPGRIWIVCAGLGEWGSSGTAWFLANKWKELLKANSSFFNPFGILQNRNFAAIVRVPKGKDGSAKLIEFFKVPKDVEKCVRKIKEERSSGSIPSPSYPSTLPTGPSSSSIPPEAQDSTVTIDLSENGDDDKESK